MKSRSFFSAIALMAAGLVTLGIAGFWGLTSQTPRTLIERGGQSAPLAAQFVPRQAPVMVSLLARPDRVWQLRQLLTAPGRRYEARQEWQSLKTALADWMGWDYDTDVRPWLDQEVTLAVTTPDLDRDRSNGAQAGYLAVLGCQDGQAARAALHLLWQQRAATGKNLVFETVSGVPLIHDSASNTLPFLQVKSGNQEGAKIGSLASAVVSDRYVLLANHPQVIRQAIATFQAPDVSLANTVDYRQSLKTLPTNRVGWVYANLPFLSDWLGLEATEIAPLFGEANRRAHHLFISLRARPSGVIGHTTIAAAPGTTFPATNSTTPVSTEALNLLPAETVFATAGHDLAHTLSETSASIGGYAVTQRAIAALLDTVQLSGTLPPLGLWSALQGDYALALLAGNPAAWVLITQDTETPFAPLDEFAQQQGLSISQVPFADSSLTTWTRLSLSPPTTNGNLQLQTQVVGVHTRVRGLAVLSTSLAGLQQVMQITESSSLGQHPPFLELVDQLDQPARSLTYLNWPQLLPRLSQKYPVLRLINQAGQPITHHLGPWVVQGEGSAPDLQRGEIAVQLLENPPQAPKSVS